MNRSTAAALFSMAALLAATANALAQPGLTSLGSGTPLSVTNDLSGSYYIGGAGLSTASAARWTLTGVVLTATEATGGNGGGKISTANGTYLTTGFLNNPRFGIGNTATGVTPAFNPNPTLVASPTSPANTEFGGARRDAPANTLFNMGSVGIIPFTPNPGGVSLVGITCAADVATATTSATHSLVVGSRVIISGNSTASYNGLKTVTGIPSGTTFEFAVTCALDGTGGTATTFEVGNSGVYGQSSSGGSTSAFLDPRNISADGRFIVGMAYVCVYNTGTTAGTSITANTFYWRPVIWDALGNAGAGSLTVLPTPFRTGTGAGANTRRRTGNPYAVSSDGLVVVGATEHNVGASPGPDIDGGRLVVWRYDTGTSTWGMSYLDTGLDANFFPKYISSTPSAVAMNAAGTIIAARGPDGITKWVWNGTSWGAPIIIGSNLGAPIAITSSTCSANVVTVITPAPHGLVANDTINIVGVTHSGTLPFGATGFNGYPTVFNVVDANTFEYVVTSCPVDTGSNPVSGTGGTIYRAASWIPASVRTCGQPPNIGGSICMSDDGNIIAGSATYSTCGSFMTQGFIWHNSDGLIKDWYDYNVSQNTPGCSSSGFWGPIGDPTPGDGKGQPVLGAPNAISPDGSAMAGRQFGNQVIIGAPPWIWQATGAACVPASITNNPAATTNFNACTSSIILNVAASGAPPLTYQWYKGATPLSNGSTGFGANYTGTDSFQFRITPATGTTLSANEAGTYSCVVTGTCGSPATSNNAIVQTDALYPPVANDACSGAIAVSLGTNVLGGAGVTPCGAYALDPNLAASCSTAKADMWYVFTPVTTGDYRLEACGANFNTVMAVYDGCGGTELACNDDFDPNQGPTCGTGESRILSVNLTGSTPYYILLAAKSTTNLTAGFSVQNLSISLAPTVVANDECAGATAAIISPTLASAGNPLDSSEAIAGSTTNCVAGITARDVWFQYTTPATPACGRIALTTCPGGGTWNSVIEVFDSCGGSVLACNDNMGGTGPAGCTTSSQAGIRMLPTLASTTYYIRVGGNSATAFGVGKLHLFVLGDTNGDGARTPADISNFVTGVMAGTYSIFADMDGSGTINGLDVQPFVECLAL